MRLPQPLHQPHDLVPPEPAGLVHQPREVLVGRLDYLGRVRRVLHQEERAQVADEGLDEPPGFLAVLHQAAEDGQRPGGVPVGDQVDHLEDQVGLDLAEHLRELLMRYELAGKVCYLVHHPYGVAHRAVRVLGDHAHRLFLDLYALAGSDVLEQPAHVLRGHQAEVEFLAARDDRGQELMRLSGRQDEDDVAGRLLQRLE